MLFEARAGHTPSIALLLFVAAAFAVAGSLAALLTPGSELWWGNRTFPKPRWQISPVNRWMFDDENGRTPSPAGVVFIRVFGCLLLIPAVAFTVLAFQQL